jgi:hypothetical protein
MQLRSNPQELDRVSPAVVFVGGVDLDLGDCARLDRMARISAYAAVGYKPI